MRTAQRFGGQVLLLVLLGVTGVLFMVLSIASRSISDLSQTNQSQSSSQAFSAAEAGIENALSGNYYVDPQGLGGATYTSAKAPYSQGNYFNVTNPLSSGEVGYLWLASHNVTTGNLEAVNSFTGSSIHLCWGNPGASEIPALEMEVYYDTSGVNAALIGDYSKLGLAKVIFDPVSPRNPPNYFSTGVVADDASCVLGGITYAYGAQVNLGTGGLEIASSCWNSPGCLLLVTAKIIYSSTKQNVGFISGGTNFPSQGFILESTGKADNTLRKVQLVQTYENSDALFTNGIFSANNVTN
jgi:hypothetical protein